MLVCLIAGENALGLCLMMFPCQTPPSQDQQLTQSRAYGKWKLCGAGCNGIVPVFLNKSTEFSIYRCKDLKLVTEYGLNYYHSVDKGFFLIKAPILLYKLILDQYKHYLLQAEDKAAHKVPRYNISGSLLSSCTDYRGARDRHSAQQTTLLAVAMCHFFSSGKRDFQNLTRMVYHANSTCAQGEDSSSCVYPIKYTIFQKGHKP